jgi:peptidoglycan/LPS O-acetylase OafA/YrhL
MPRWFIALAVGAGVLYLAHIGLFVAAEFAPKHLQWPIQRWSFAPIAVLAVAGIIMQAVNLYTGEETLREFGEFFGFIFLLVIPAFILEKTLGFDVLLTLAATAAVVVPLFVLYLRYRGPQIRARKERWTRERNSR